jgi:Pyruvate/2-oxoacid:ferredoxin oxidoreductase delta subunit
VGHAAGLGRAHQDLAKRLLRGPVAMVEPQDPAARRAWREILETLFSPDDAALAARLPVVPATLADLCRRTGMGEGDLRARLEAMAGKGLVLDLHDARTGATTYMLAPPVVGFFELSMMRLSDGPQKERLARAYEAYMAGDSTFDAEVSGVPTVVSRTLVQETALYDDLASEVLDRDRATAYVEAADCVAVTNCFCRHVATHLGTACDYPMETCMSLGTAARYLVRHGHARQIGREEGLELLAAAREHGLVHIADNVRQELNYICSCCACCCVELRSAQKGMPVMQPSAFEAAVDVDRCTGCGSCVCACPVQAISLVAHGAPQGDGDRAAARLVGRVDLDRCLGCGVCVGACKQDSLTMVRRPQAPHVPLNAVEYLTRRMLERGKLADLLVDGTAGRGPSFANAVLGAILSLPPAQKLLAGEQVQSRFVQFALARYQPPGG